MALKIIASVITAALVFSSCNSIESIPVTMYSPPEYPVPGKIQSIALLNRCMTGRFINFKNDFIPAETRIGNNNLNFTRSFHDSIVADTVIISAAKSIFETGRFDVVVPRQRNLIRNDRKRMADPLDPVFVEQLCKDYEVDGLLVLENFSETYARRLKIPFPTYYRAKIRLTCDSDWRLYLPQQNPHFINIECSDVLLWDTGTFFFTLKEMYKSLPGIKEALIEGGYALGFNISNKFVPGLKDDVRSYHRTGNKNIDTAISLIYENKWEEAEEIWRKHSSVKSGTKRSKIEFNLALCSEIKGDYENAIEWAQKSLKTKYYRATELYLLKLNENQAKFIAGD